MQYNITTLAMQFASVKYHVFPLLKNLISKKNKIGTPLGWNHNRPDEPLSIPSTCDKLEIAAWDHLYGSNLLGFGVHPKNKRTLILDVDVGKDRVGLESLNKLIHDHSLPKASFAVSTKSGGIHLYYEYPKIIDSIVGLPIAEYPNIDIRSENNFVVGPGSFNNKYSIKYGTVELPLVSLPESFINILPRKSRITKQSVSLISSESKDIALTGKIPDKIFVGERDNTLIRLIGSWVRSGLTRDNIIILTKEALNRCQTPQDERPLSIDDYIDKIDSTIDKTEFSRPLAEPLQFFIDNMVYVKVMGGVYEIHTRTLYLKDLTNHYAPHIYFVDVEDKNGNISTKTKSAFSEWMKHKNRKAVHNIGYCPIEDFMFFDDIQNQEVVNMYRPPQLPAEDKIQKDKLIYENIFDKFIDFCQYLFGSKSTLMIEWAAHQIQHPQEKLMVAPVLISEARGVGKNLFFDIMSTILGKHNTSVFTSDNILESHNDYIIRNHLVLINEAYTPSVDRWSKRSKNQSIEKIKMLITDHAQSVNPKFVPPFIAKSYVNYIFASNNLDAVPVEQGDRRFEIIIIDALPKEKSYYVPLWDITKNNYDGRLLAAELKRGLKGIKINTMNPSYTAAYDEQKRAVITAGLSNIETMLQTAITNNFKIFKKDVVTFELFMWFVTTFIDPTVSLEYGRSIFKTVCKPIRSKNSRKNKILMVPTPPLNIKGNFIPPSKNKKAIYTCRRFSFYQSNILSSNEYIEQYLANYGAVNLAENEEKKEGKVLSFMEDFKR